MTSNAPADALIKEIREKYSDTPFLALGQTVFWDEPMKAVWRRLLDQSYPDAQFIAGIHDTDYFAKTTALVHDDNPYVLLPHDDAATRGLWSAAGEMSALFGSEDLPTRAAYEKNHIPFNSLSVDFHGSRRDFLSDKTAAWGWRGIVETGSHQKIAHDVKLSDFLPTLMEQLDWAFSTSIAELAVENQQAAIEFADQVKHWVKQIAEDEDDCCLAQLYEKLLPKFYETLLGAAPSNFDTTTSIKLFRFNTSTCHLPRFRFVELFIDPSTSKTCRDAYNRAVAGGGMYALDAFGEGALPFDIVVTGVGRGTLHVTSRSVVVDLPNNKLRIDDVSVTSLTELATLLEQHLGSEVALVGKAVALISMIAGEFVIVFHETASGYTDRTTAMNDTIRAAGIALDLKPIVRVQYPTWDALSALGDAAQFELPPHLSRAFGTRKISADKFSKEWRTVIEQQNSKLSEMRELRTPRALMEYLESANDESKCWPCHLQLYNEAQFKLAELAQKRERLKGYIANLRQDRHVIRQAVERLHRRKGKHYRQVIRPLQEHLALAKSDNELANQLQRKESARGRHFDDRIGRMNRLVKQMTRVIHQFRDELRKSESSLDAVEARHIAQAATLDAQLARLEHVRTALITTSALPHTQARPSAWWLPLVDPTNTWFNTIAEQTTARLERV